MAAAKVSNAQLLQVLEGMNGGMNAMREDVKDVKERLAVAEGLEENFWDLEVAMEGRFDEAKAAHEAPVLDMDLR
eukprot:3087246-Pyramimonas_sp.AAC.1